MADALELKRAEIKESAEEAVARIAMIFERPLTAWSSPPRRERRTTLAFGRHQEAQMSMTRHAGLDSLRDQLVVVPVC